MQKSSVLEGLFLFLLSEYLIHDYCNGAIARYIAGGSETVHRNIESYHECLHISIETQYGGKRTERSHDGSSRNSRSCYHADGEHEDEIEEDRADALNCAALQKF